MLLTKVILLETELEVLLQRGANTQSPRMMKVYQGLRMEHLLQLNCYYLHFSM